MAGQGHPASDAPMEVAISTPCRRIGNLHHGKGMEGETMGTSWKRGPAAAALVLPLVAFGMSSPEVMAQQGVDFIRENAASDWLERSRRNEILDLQADEMAQRMAIRKRELARAIAAERQKGALDAALRRGLAEMYGDSADPVLRALLATPGGGTAALRWIEKTKPAATP